MSEPILLSWSSGKDSAWALYRLQQQRALKVVGLLTTVTAAFDRVSMHGVRRDVLEAQAAAAGLPLHQIEIPSPCPNEVYEAKMKAAMEQARRDGIETVAFGDLFLEDIRVYREENLARIGMRAVFPIWQEPTDQLAATMVDRGLEAVVVCVDPGKVDRSFCGRRYDDSFLADLPPDVDPCGENGEFHTLAFGGPMFGHTLDVAVGETVKRDGFVFTDVTLRL